MAGITPRARPHLLVLALAAAPVTAGAQAARPGAAPPSDSATVAAGRLLFEGRGLCATCHGVGGEGMLGPTTTLNAGKQAWLHHDGTLEGVARLITVGVDADHSRSGQVMPPRGGSRLTDAQVRQVAAYVVHLHAQPLTP
jgi:mono/diheme cytochrome c family protein